MHLFKNMERIFWGVNNELMPNLKAHTRGKRYAILVYLSSAKRWKFLLALARLDTAQCQHGFA